MKYLWLAVPLAVMWGLCFLTAEIFHENWMGGMYPWYIFPWIMTCIFAWVISICFAVYKITKDLVI